MEVVTVYGNLNGSCIEILRKTITSQALVAAMAFKDCNKYCKKDTGALMKSGKVRASDGVMTWDTEYARAAYYTGEPDRSKNPSASLMWAHKAASIHGTKWKKLVERVMK